MCALARSCAAERRLTVTGPCVHRRLHISFPCPFQESPWSSGRNFIRNFAYDRLAPKVPPGPSVYPLYPKVTYSKGSGPHMPVAPDPSSEPRGAPCISDLDSSRQESSVLATAEGPESFPISCLFFCISYEPLLDTCFSYPTFLAGLSPFPLSVIAHQTSSPPGARGGHA